MIFPMPEREIGPLFEVADVTTTGELLSRYIPFGAFVAILMAPEFGAMACSGLMTEPIIPSLAFKARVPATIEDV